MILGERRWKRVLPFFLPAVIFGAQGLVYDSRQQSAYSFHLGLPALWKTASFYSSQLLGIPYAGFVFLLLPWFVRDRRLWFGVSVLLLGLAVYLILPGRLFAIYTYFAMTGVAMVVAVLMARRPSIVLALLLLWTGWQWVLLLRTARETLAAAADRHAFVDAVRQVPPASEYLYDTVPESLHAWGVEGALRLYHGFTVKAHQLGEAGRRPEPGLVLLNWDPRARHLAVAPIALDTAEYVRMDRPTPAWQFVAGWHAAVGGYRAIDKRATARLYRAANRKDFEWDACSSGPAELRTFIEGEELPTVFFKGEKCVHMHGTLKPAPAAVVTLDFVVSETTARIGNFGFVAGTHK